MLKLLTCAFEFNGNDLLLNDETLVMQTLQEIVSLAGFTVCKKQSHNFTPVGVSVAMILSESHIAAHTWPEKNFGYIALTSCKAIPDSFYSETVATITTNFVSTSVTYETI